MRRSRDAGPPSATPKCWATFCDARRTPAFYGDLRRDLNQQHPIPNFKIKMFYLNIFMTMYNCIGHNLNDLHI